MGGNGRSVAKATAGLIASIVISAMARNANMRVLGIINFPLRPAINASLFVEPLVDNESGEFAEANLEVASQANLGGNVCPIGQKRKMRITHASDANLRQ